MKYSVEYSKAAVRDLDRVWSEVLRASRSYDITERYLNDLMNIVESKSEYPLSGAPLYYEDRFTGYYFVVFKEYLAFYRLKSKRILVDRVLFGRSDYIRILQLGTIRSRQTKASLKAYSQWSFQTEDKVVFMP